MTTENQNITALVADGLPTASNKTGVDRPYAEAMDAASCEVKDTVVTQLVSRVYESAPPELRGQLLDRLIQPLGLLSLLSIAGHRRNSIHPPDT